MQFEKLVIHEVEGFSHKIVTSAECPEFGFLAWAAKPNQAGINIEVSIPGLDNVRLRIICGCCQHYRTPNGQWREDKKAFIKAVRTACKRVGIKKLCFQNSLYNSSESATLIEMGTKELELLDPLRSDFDRVRLEEEFSEVVNLEFRLNFFESYYVHEKAIRQAQDGLRKLRARRDGLDAAWGWSSRVQWHEIPDHIENIRMAIEQTPLTWEDLKTSEWELQTFLK
ncbi:MAG: hypothetical protein P1P90_02295 [Patescibacteria group bacterium]|nr:hypothetical protein [Patescibacteria group bacterium]